MFKIKTKKDIRIEELEKEVKLLTAIINRPRFEYKEKDVQMIWSAKIIEKGEPVEHAKMRIESGFIKYLEPYIHYDIEDDYSLGYLSQRIVGRLQVVKNRRLGKS